MKNLCLGLLGPLILDPKNVIYASGSMLSCILCERQNFLESHKLKRALVSKISSERRDLWPFRLFDVVWMQWNEWSGISLWVV